MFVLYRRKFYSNKYQRLSRTITWNKMKNVVNDCIIKRENAKERLRSNRRI